MDLIKRQDAIDACLNGYCACVSDCVDEIEKLPSMQVPSYVAEIEAEYKKAVSQPWIHKPLAKALYEVWKKHDREDVSRAEDE